MKKRFFRLMPVYYLALAVHILFSNALMPMEHTETNIVKNTFFHVVFLHGLVPKYNNSMIGVEWYIGVLAIFFLVCPILYLYVNSIKKILSLFIISTAGSVGIIEVFNRIITGNKLEILSYINELGIIPQFPVIILGWALYAWSRKWYCGNEIYKKINII